MLKKFIIIENGEECQTDDFKDIVKILIDENYYDLSNEEKKEAIERKAIANTLGTDFKVINNMDDIKNIDDIEGKIIIKDATTYILSLLLTNKIILLERKDANFFTSKINVNDIKENYIIINAYAKELLYRIWNNRNI